MKNLFTLLICCLLCTSLFSQRDETIFNNTAVRITGIWGGPLFNFTQFGNDFSAFSGGYGGLEFNKYFFIGYGGYDLSDNFDINGLVDQDYNLNYHGPMLGFFPLANKAIHPSIMVMGGPGEIYNHSDGNDDIYVIQTSAGVEVNVFRWARIGADFGYRFVNDVDLLTLTNNDLSSFYGELKLKFGWSWGKVKPKRRFEDTRFEDRDL